MEGLLPELEVVRKDFPILERTLAGGMPLVYLDSANTSQKPQVVIDAMVDHLERHNANIARAMHQLGAESTEAYEAARDRVATFLNAPSRNEVVFTKNATEALNLLARTIDLGPGDNVVITEMEHHSNIVSWQLACERSGAELRWFGLTDEGQLDLSNADQLVDEHTKVVAYTWVSNMLGTINPVADLAARAKAVGAYSVIDASQAVPQLPVDVAATGCDFLVFTGHKAVGPTGIGVLWGREELLNELPPFHGGGEMIETVTMARLDLRQGAAPLRGRHAADRRGDRPRCGARLPRPPRHGRRARARAGDHRLRARGAADRARADRARAAVGGRPRGSDLLRDRGCAPPRRGHRARHPRRRRPCRPPLREAGARAVRRAELDPHVVVPLHDAGRDRRAGRGPGIHPLVLQVGFMMDLDNLYQEILLDHYKNPHHKGLREPFEAEVHHVNPTCGDEVTLRVHLSEGVVQDVSYDALGCSISQAAASVMTDLVIGKSVDEAMQIHSEFLALMQGKGTVEPDEDVLEDGIAFAGVAKFPARVKCALLSWMAWKDATAQSLEASNG